PDRSHRLCQGYELVESRAPTFVKAHLLVLGSARLVAVGRDRRVLGSTTMGLEQDGGREDVRSAGGSGASCRPVSGQEGVGPHQLYDLDDLEVAADVGRLLPLRGLHHRAKDAARTQID